MFFIDFLLHLHIQACASTYLFSINFYTDPLKKFFDISGLMCYTDCTKKFCLELQNHKIFCIYMLIQRHGFVNDKIYIFEDERIEIVFKYRDKYLEALNFINNVNVREAT